MSAPPEHVYVGQELELVAHARNWKRYWGQLLEPALHGAVLEVGAGLGANTRALRSGRQRRWVCLEPDARLVERLRASLAGTPLADTCEVRLGTIDTLAPDERFDAILYLDVLEHVADDVGELRRAAAHVEDGGRLAVLAPAHGWLFSAFDAAVGHRRRYDQTSLAAVAAGANRLRLERMVYLDSCGMLAALANRFLLRQRVPTLRQIRLWDRVLVPASRRLDPLLRYRVGRSLLAIWSCDGLRAQGTSIGRSR